MNIESIFGPQTYDYRVISSKALRPKTMSKGKLAFLNNSMTVFESEMDRTGNILNKEWEWK